MRRLVFGVSFLVVLGFARPGFAQPVVPGGGLQRPTVSPYVNLLRGSGGIGNAALNYYGIVRPEQQFRQQAGMMQQQIAANSQNLSNLASGGDGDQPLITGKGASFMNYSHYFNNMGGGGGGGMSRPGGSFGGGAPSIGVGINTGGGGGRSSGMTIQAPQGGGARRR